MHACMCLLDEFGCTYLNDRRGAACNSFRGFWELGRQLLDAHGTGASGFQPSTAAGTRRSQLVCCSGRDGLDLDMDMGQPR